MPSFEFDPDKSAANLVKHGIDFDAAQALWDDPSKIAGRADYPDEVRWLVVGKIDNKIWSAVVTEREGRIRLISVRRARKNEEMAYDRKTSFSR